MYVIIAASARRVPFDEGHGTRPLERYVYAFGHGLYLHTLEATFPYHGGLQAFLERCEPADDRAAVGVILTAAGTSIMQAWVLCGRKPLHFSEPSNRLPLPLRQPEPDPQGGLRF